MRYRQPGSNRHAHHWARDFKALVSTYSTMAAHSFRQKATAKVQTIFGIAKKKRTKVLFYPFFYRYGGSINRNLLIIETSHYFFLVAAC